MKKFFDSNILHRKESAVILKVACLLYKSIETSFLHRENVLVEKTRKLLKKMEKTLEMMASVYFRDKDMICSNCLLTEEEEVIARKHLKIEQKKIRAFNDTFVRLHSNRDFVNLAEKIDQVNIKSIDLSTFGAIVVQRFRIDHYFPLFDIALSKISKENYSLFLLHLISRSRSLEDFDILLKLAASLLVVNSSNLKFEIYSPPRLEFSLKKRMISFDNVKSNFLSPTYNYYDSNKYDREVAAYNRDLVQVKRYLGYYTDRNDLPNSKNVQLSRSTPPLEYLSRSTVEISVTTELKRAIGNNNLFNFLVSVLKKCDKNNNNNNKKLYHFNPS